MVDFDFISLKICKSLTRFLVLNLVKLLFKSSILSIGFYNSFKVKIY